jgi:glucose-1-phosphate thymidylyltransferase
MKGIVLAGGTGSRLWPITKGVSKQLLPVYDKPMIYYPISTLMLAGIQEILIITTPHDLKAFQDLLGDGSKIGVSFSYAIQPSPDGLAQALIIGEDFLDGDSCLLILGDNIFHGAGLGHELARSLPSSGSHIFTYIVSNPSEYGVLEIDNDSNPVSITEKPKNFVSNLAVTGLYFFDSKGPANAKNIKPSPRGELEITSLIDCYLKDKSLTYTALTRGTAWLDTGNPNSLNDAANYIRIIEERTGLKIGCLEEVALNNSWIDHNKLAEIAVELGNNSYSRYLISLSTQR